MEYLYAPGCALLVYKPLLAEKLKQYIESHYGRMATLTACCFNKPVLEPGTCIITPCATCNNRYRSLYKDCRTIYILDVIANDPDFPFPDYGGIEMTVHDACAGRTDDLYMNAIRKLLERMNIRVVEAERSRKKGKCCGQVFYGKLPLNEVEQKMKMRADEMPCDDVVVYCASCMQGISVGGKRPHYILDLLFNEPTEMGPADVEGWNKKLKDFRYS